MLQVYEKSWVNQYYNFEPQVDNGVVYFYNKNKKRPTESDRFAVWVRLDNITKLYFHNHLWWDQQEWPEYILSETVSGLKHGFPTQNAPGVKTLIYEPPFFIFFKSLDALPNFLSFIDFTKSNLESTVLAMLSYDEEHNVLHPVYAPELFLSYSQVLLNNLLEFRLYDSKNNLVILNDRSKLFFMLTIL